MQVQAKRGEDAYQDWLNKTCLAIWKRQEATTDIGHAISQKHIGYAARAVAQGTLRWGKPGSTVVFRE